MKGLEPLTGVVVATGFVERAPFATAYVDMSPVPVFTTYTSCPDKLMAMPIGLVLGATVVVLRGVFVGIPFVTVYEATYPSPDEPELRNPSIAFFRLHWRR
jgi:hypothetical protein